MLTKEQLYLETFMDKHHPDRPRHEHNMCLAALRDRDMRRIKRLEQAKSDREWFTWFRDMEKLFMKSSSALTKKM